MSGARFAISDPLAVLAAGVTMVVASLAVGFTLAGAFVLTRRANLLANVIQHPVYLLGGFVVPRDALPDWLRPSPTRCRLDMSWTHCAQPR